MVPSISTNNAAKPGCGQDSALTWKLTRLMVIMGLLLGLKISQRVYLPRQSLLYEEEIKKKQK